jgi:hypothetical protein
MNTERQKAFEKLKCFISNPGRFCLTVFGGRGTGKKFLLNLAIESFKGAVNEKDCLEKVHFFTSDQLPDTDEGIDELFKVVENGILVIEDFEEMNSNQEKLLLKALATQNGKFGIDQEFDLRIVFTTTLSPEILRSESSPVSGPFWDRISQLIVMLPSYKQNDEGILYDFRKTWDKMQFHKIKGFEGLSSFPANSELEHFIRHNSDKLDGGFRDLDKLAILYFNYRIFHYLDGRKIQAETEMLVLQSVKSDFLGKSQYAREDWSENSTFHFVEGKNFNELKAEFRIQLRKWAVGKNGTLEKAAKRLKCSPSTLKNFVEGKATASQKKKY